MRKKELHISNTTYFLKRVALVTLCLILPFTVSATAVKLNERQMYDLEMLSIGAFAPLNGFLTEDDYNSVVHDMRLRDGTLWPMPITLDVSAELAASLSIGEALELKDAEGTTLAKLNVASVWRPNKISEAMQVFGTIETGHPAVDYLMHQSGSVYVGGEIEMVQPFRHYDFTDLRRTPSEMRAYFEERGIDKVVAFQTRNPMHRAHVELTKRAAAISGAHLLLQPVVGQTRPGDIDKHTRVRCYKQVLNYFPQEETTLSVLPLAMRMGGPREALWHAIIRKNYGATHFIVGRDHAGPGKAANGLPFYDPYDAQRLVQKHAAEIGITLVAIPEMVYVQEIDNYLPVPELKEGMTPLSISGTELRRRLRENEEIPTWLSYPEVIDELAKVYPPREKQGFTLFFTGLSGAGKSTLARAIEERLNETENRSVTLLDGDIIRQHLSAGLGFSREDRSINVKRVGFVANEITKNGGIALCSMIAPYNDDRAANRAMIKESGGFIEIHVATPLEVCEGRDVKGLYAKARQGIIKEFTGIDDPYEEPEAPELVIDTSQLSIEEAIETILGYLREENYLAAA